MSLLKGAVAAAAIATSLVLGTAASPAAPVSGIVPMAPVATDAPLVEKVHGYHRHCRWSSRWGLHRHWRGRVRFCDDGPGITFNFGYYYGPYLYWGPPLRSYRGHYRGHRVEGRHHRRGHMSGPRRFRGDRRIQSDRQYRRFPGKGQRQLKRRRTDIPATIVTTGFAGGSTQVIGILPARAA